MAGADVSGLAIQNITVENMYCGSYLYCYADINNTTFFNCHNGILTHGSSGLRVSNCEFDVTGNGVECIMADDIDIVDSYFFGATHGVKFYQTANTNIRNCYFSENHICLLFEYNSNGNVYDCTTNETGSTGVLLLHASVVNLEHNRLFGGMDIIAMDELSHLTGSQNIMSGSRHATISMWRGSTIDMHTNHIFIEEGYLVVLGLYEYQPLGPIDMTNNYWGITNADSISALIWDGNDDLSIHAYVEFIPFSGQPMPTETKSWGGVKSLYR